MTVLAWDHRSPGWITSLKLGPNLSSGEAVSSRDVPLIGFGS